VVCQAQSVQQVSAGFAAVALAATVGFANVDAAYADISGLTPCSESKAFAKVQKKEIKGLQKRLKLVGCGTDASGVK
jgi:photosystem I subunit 3